MLQSVHMILCNCRRSPVKRVLHY